MPKTIAEINQKIKKGKVVVVTAEEIIGIVAEKGSQRAAEEVDVVTTGTFGPMCSSGAFINFGQSKPKIKAQKVWLNDISAYAGLAAVNIYIGATEISDNDPANKVFPGKFSYGGGHVIEDLVAGKNIRLHVTAYGTDCCPRKELHTLINIKDLNEAVLCNPRNACQNYNVAVNLSNKVIYTCMGILQPNLGSANYCSAGQLSPLLNDPLYETIGLGTRIFLGGGVGYVYWQGTHSPAVPAAERRTHLPAVPAAERRTHLPAGTIAVSGDLKQMSPEWLRGTSFTGYGATLTVGIGIPIPVLNEEIVKFTAVKDEEIFAKIVDYSEAYPAGKSQDLGEVNYKELKSGKISVKGKDVPTGGLSSYAKARKIAAILKDWINKGKFLLTESVQRIPSTDSGVTFKPLKERSIE